MPIRVVVVDDSDIARWVLRETLEAEGDIRVIGEAADGDGAIETIGRLRPDLATIDLSMPGMNGLDAIEQIMASHPVPIVVVTAQVVSPGEELVFDAVRRGALEVCPKPRGAREGQELRGKIRRLAGMPVVRHVAGRLRARPPEPSPERAPPRAPCPVVGIAASAGGPAALVAVLRALPSDFAGCIAVVQHLPSGYAPRFAQHLADHASLPVELAQGRVPLRPSRIYVAPDDRHLIATSGGLDLGTDPPVVGHRPSATVLFQSLARWHGADAVGVVLTGIGSDGAQGLLELQATGAVTIAQDEASSAVYGMPRAAHRAGAVTRVLGLGDIAPALCAIVGRRHVAGAS